MHCRIKNVFKKLKELLKNNISKIKNFGWSFVASIISTFVLQLVVHPILASMLNETDYGLLLFVIGIANVVLLTFGNSLGDIRLTMNQEYTDDKTGDFNIILMVVSGLSAIFMIAFLFNYKHLNLWNIVFLSAYCFLGVLNSYLTCLFRAKLMFREGFISNIILAVSYMAGLIAVYLTSIWALVFFVGYLISDIYLIIKTGVIKHGFFVTKNMKTIIPKYSQLSFSYALKSGLTYVDRFIIYPMLGSGMISVYTVATVLGKCVSLALQPMANVMLGYYAQPNSVMKIKEFRITYILTIGFGVLSFMIVWLFSSLFIRLLYPTYIDSTKQYLFIGNMITIIGALSSIIQPALLKYAKMYWQIIIQIVYGVMAVALSIILIPDMALYGFCLALLIANVFKFLMMIVIGEYSIKWINK